MDGVLNLSVRSGRSPFCAWVGGGCSGSGMLGMNRVAACLGLPVPKGCGHSAEGIAAVGGLGEICSCGCAVLNTRLGREKAPPAHVGNEESAWKMELVSA